MNSLDIKLLLENMSLVSRLERAHRMSTRDSEFDEVLRAQYPAQRVEVLERDCDPAELLFEMDGVLYNERRKAWRVARRSEILGENEFDSHVFDRNRQRFDELRRLVGRGRLVPFVGAGVGVACGMPTWRAFLLRVANEHSPALTSDITTRLDAGQYEDAAQHLMETLREPRFAETFDRTFSLRPGASTSRIIQLIRRIAYGCIVTTNFDRLIESQLHINDIFLGRAATEFHRALADGEPALLKLHGDLRSVANRVLTRAEYDSAYGPESRPNLSLPLPDAMARLFGHHRLLFVGCSLGSDRTLRILHELVRNHGEARFPRHYAIAEAPGDPSALNERESFLNDRMIFPIWYPSGWHDVVPALLQELVNEGE